MKKKVVIVGAGMVGAANAYSLINQGLVNELVLIDVNKEAAEGHAFDLNDSVAFLPSQPEIYAGEYSDCKDADVVVITAGIAQKPGQPRTELIGTNAKIMQSIVKDVMGSGFDGIILVASNPADIMTSVAYRASGLPKNRVIGAGTVLDSGRLKNALGKYLGYNEINIHANILGEHGDSSMVPWSTATVGQKLVLDIVAESNGKYTMEGLQKCFEESRDRAYDIIDRKGATYFGIGISLARIIKSIFMDDGAILTCSTFLEGDYGIEGLYLPVPVVVGREGIERIQHLNLTAKELEQLQASAAQLKQVAADANVEL